MAKYVLTGIHTRLVDGQVKIYVPGETIEPTPFELVSFPNKFMLMEEKSIPMAAKLQNDTAEDDELEDDGIIEGDGKETSEVNLEALDELRDKLTILIESDEYEDSVVEEAKKFLKRAPEKQHTIDALVESIEKFLSELEDAEEVE